MVGYDVAKNEAYFRKACQNAIDLCVMLCKKYGLSENDIIGHAEGHRQGIASNHADVMHWFPKHSESMDTFRAAVKTALGGIPSIEDSFSVGDVVDIKASAARYYPSGPTIPSWVKDTYHKVTQTTAGGQAVIRGGKSCVLLGRKVDKQTGKESAGIMTWVDKDELKLITQETQELEVLTDQKKYYRVQVGAFSKKENAEALLKKIKAAGFDAYMKYD